MADRLKEYRRKRDFKITSEPGRSRAGRGTTAGPLHYVIHLHHARRRHFDLRLELGGSLRSWAVPKGPSLDPGQKRLAVQVEDHPLDYAGFEGDIPPGQYGAGHVDIWDQGEWTPHGAAEADLRKGHLSFELNGQRLGGSWSLVRTSRSERQPHWLLIKKDDDASRSGDIADDTPLRTWRAARGRRRPIRPAGSETAGGRTAAGNTTGRRTAGGKAVAGKAAPARRTGAAPFPHTVGLQLGRLAARAPEGDGWLHEIKFDGYRMLVMRQGDTVRIVSRGGQDYTAKLPAIRDAALQLPCTDCIVDGEVVALDAQGRSHFDTLQQRLGEGGALQLMAFDLLHLDGHDLRPLPLTERRKHLRGLLPQGPLLFSDCIEGSGAAAFAAACEAGLEGIMSKAADAPYREGRHGEWLKVKCVHSDEFAVVGYTRGKGARAALGSLLLAAPAGKRWRYVGRVGSGIGDADVKELLGRFKTAQRPVPLDNPPTPADLRGAAVHWVRPELVVEVDYRALTDSGLLRQGSLKGWRPDKSTASLRHPDAAPRIAAATRDGRGGGDHHGSDDRRSRPTNSRRRKPSSPSGSPTGIHFTHPERQLFQSPPITKAALGAFYTDIADWILPELLGRPLSLVRCPDGAEGTCFFQKHLSKGYPAAIRETRPLGDGRRYVYIEDLEGLLGLVQMNVLEFHPWGSRVADSEHPDRLVFDLDPAPGVPWARVVEAADEVRRRLAALRLESFLRASGGKGLHVVLPLRGDDTWDSAKAFARALAASMAQDEPDRYVDVATKARREGRIFIDYLRNSRGATSVASYSLRARPGAPIAMPLAWSELRRVGSASRYGYANARARLQRMRDPWKDIDRVEQALPSLNAAGPSRRKRGR